FKDSLLSFFSGAKSFSSNKLNLKRMEKTFRDSIIPTIAFSAHATDTVIIVDSNIVEALARDLKAAFPQVHGFSERNVWNMRRLYEEYKNKPFLQQLVAEIPWGHNLLIMEKIYGDKEREYYIKSSRDLGWSRNVLLNQVKAGAYEFSLKQKSHNFPKVLPMYLAEQADESIKSVYNLDFLDITKSVIERELERRLVERIKRFMLELGKGFSFLAIQEGLK
ncbi:MAG: DUF1016 family protein, partial [Candidatus Omnitrophica bacterium]|nr:DUF1016 family protein [Candidatus Omnitrophota bacterium]